MDTPEPTDELAIKRRWKNRRWMAWFSLIALVILGQEMLILLFWLPTETLEAASGVFIAIVFVLASVVGAYVGASTIAESGFWNRK